MMMRDLFYIAAGYLLGSILFAPLFGSLFGHKDILKESRDHNPGTANAFLYGGFWCGVLTLCCDLFKGFLPVYFYSRHVSLLAGTNWIGSALILAAPVVGHIFPIFSGFRGGKGIATSFGCLLGLVPMLDPVLLLAFSFIFFSLILRITPHYYRTICTYVCTLVLMCLCHMERGILSGFAVIVLTVLIRMHTSDEEKERMKVRILWMH